MIRHLTAITACLAMFVAASASQATIIGFANSAGNNAKVPADLGSFAAADGTAFTVSNGATPNIGVEFVNPTWDYHHSGNFDVIENFTAGGAWDSDGDPDIAHIKLGPQPLADWQMEALGVENDEEAEEREER